MPFDGVNDPTALFKQRREDAIKLWLNVPKGSFNLSNWRHVSRWKSKSLQLCALAWLAEKEHDNWYFHMGYPSYLTLDRGAYSNEMVYYTAADYFGLTFAEAKACFGCHENTKKLYNRWFISMISAKDVQEKLMSFSYYTHPYNVSNNINHPFNYSSNFAYHD